METQKNIKEPKATPSTASKTASRKQSGGEASSNQGATGSQGGATGTQRAPETQGATGNQGGAGEKGGGQDLLQQAKQTTGEIVNQVQERAGSQLTRQKENAATELTTIVNAVRRFGESLGGEETGPIARYAAQYGDKAAENLERLSTYIREKDPKELLNDVQNFGRRRPAWLLGGAFILGFAGARLIRSSIEAASQHQEFHSGGMRPNLPAPRPSTPSARTPGPIKPTSNVR